MIEYLTKDLLTVNHGIIAHGCNCQGKMGAGIAKEVRSKWPPVYYMYVDKCYSTTNKRGLLGEAQVIPVSQTPWGQLFVANLFTQERYGREPIRYADPDAIKTALRKVAKFCVDRDLPLYMSKIGCSLGGLSWVDDVEPIVQELSDELNIPIYVCTK